MLQHKAQWVRCLTEFVSMDRFLIIDSGCEMNSKLILSLVITGFVLIFLFQNTEVVTIQFLFWSASMSRSLLILVFVAIGVVIGWILNSHIALRR